MLAVLTFGACTGDGAGTGLAHDRFVDVIVSLRQAANQTYGDPAAFAAQRDRILADAGVTEQELRVYVETHARDLEHMAAVWDSVNARLADPEVQ